MLRVREPDKVVADVYNGRMATTKKTSPKAAKKPNTPRPTRLPLVLVVKSASDAKQVQAAMKKLLDAGVLKLLSFERAHAFLAKAPGWQGPGYVVRMK